MLVQVFAEAEAHAAKYAGRKAEASRPEAASAAPPELHNPLPLDILGRSRGPKS